MATYDVGSFVHEMLNGYTYQALSKLRRFPDLIPQVKQLAPNDIIKQIVENMEYILSREDLKNATLQRIADVLQNNDVKNVNVNANAGFGGEEDWHQKYIDLQQNYEQLQAMYKSKVNECEEMSDKCAQLEIEKFALEEQLKIRGEENKQLGEQIEGYMNTTNQTLEGVQEMTKQGNNTISNLRMQIKKLEMENERLQSKLNKIERNTKVEQMKKKVHEDAMKGFEPSSASKMYNEGAKKTMSLLEQFKQQRQSNMLGGGTISMIPGNSHNRPMQTGPIPMGNGAIPMPAPPGMRSHSDLRDPVIGRQGGPIIEEMEDGQRFMIKIGNFSIVFGFNPTTMTPEKIRETILPMFGNAFQVNGIVLVVPNKQQQAVDILTFMPEAGKYRSMFHGWYINYVGTNYEAIGGQRQEVLNMYKYVLSEIVRQGKQGEFGNALGY